MVLKQDQRTGKRTRGIVKDILTSSPTHPHGIKVRLTNGLVGRVQAILTPGGGEGRLAGRALAVLLNVFVQLALNARSSKPID